MMKRFASGRIGWWVLAGVLAVGVLGVGAKNIADEISTRPARQRRIERHYREWSHEIANHLRTQPVEGWRRVAEKMPEALPRACMVEVRISAPPEVAGSHAFSEHQ